MAPCVAIGCNNRHSMNLKGITYHRFPLDPYRRQQWLLAVRRANWLPGENSRLCSLHFEEHMIDRRPASTQLKKNAVPTIFEGLPPLENQKWLKSKMEVLEDISNEKNHILVVKGGLDVQAATLYNRDDKNNVVVIKDEEDFRAVLNCGNEDDIDGNRAIIVSDGGNTRTEWCGNVGEDSYPILPYDPKLGKETLESDFVDYFKIRSVLDYDPDFYVRTLKKLVEDAKTLQSKRKYLRHVSVRKRRKILKFGKEVKRLRRNVLPPKCSTQPIVHVISHVVSE